MATYCVAALVPTLLFATWSSMPRHALIALPAWITLMSEALRGQPLREIPPVEGVVQQGGDWVFEEFAGDAGVRQLGEPAAAAASAP